MHSAFQISLPPFRCFAS